MIFQDLRHQVHFVNLGVLQLISDFLELVRVKKTRNIRNAPEVSADMGFLNGVTQSGIGGASMVLFISMSHFFHLMLVCGPSTNAKAEVISLLVLLFVSLVMGLPHIRVFGDSRIIIDWVKVANL